MGAIERKCALVIRCNLDVVWLKINNKNFVSFFVNKKKAIWIRKVIYVIFPLSIYSLGGKINILLSM